MNLVTFCTFFRNVYVLAKKKTDSDPKKLTRTPLHSSWFKKLFRTYDTLKSASLVLGASCLPTSQLSVSVGAGDLGPTSAIPSAESKPSENKSCFQQSYCQRCGIQYNNVVPVRFSKAMQQIKST